MPARVLRALLMLIAAAAKLLLRALVSARISCASAYFAIGNGVLSAGYLFAVQIAEPGAVPARLALVTATRGSAMPPTVRLRYDASTVLKLLLLMWKNTWLLLRALMASFAVFTVANVDGMTVASAAALA